MMNKKIFFLLFGLVILSALVSTAGIARTRAASSSIKFDAQVADDIALDSMVMGEDHSIIFSGHTDSLTEPCLPAKVFIDGERGAWWPVYRCVEANASGEWMVRVPFDGEGSPVGIQLIIGK